MKSVPSNLRNDINITPLIDIVLVLLIVFIVMVPALAHAHRSQSANHGVQGAALELPRVSIMAEGRFLWGDEEIRRDDLLERLATALAARPREDRKVLLRIPRDMPLRSASEAMDLIHLAASKVGEAKDVRILVTESQ